MLSTYALLTSRDWATQAGNQAKKVRKVASQTDNEHQSPISVIRYLGSFLRALIPIHLSWKPSALWDCYAYQMQNKYESSLGTCI